MKFVNSHIVILLLGLAALGSCREPSERLKQAQARTLSEIASSLFLQQDDSDGSASVDGSTVDDGASHDVGKV